MAIAFVSGQVANGNAATSSTLTFSPTGGTGHDILVCVTLATSTATVSSITAAGGTATFKKIGSQTNGTSVNVELWAAADIGAGITSITANFGSSKFSIAAAEYSGIAQYGITGSATSTTTPLSWAQELVKTGSYLVSAAGLGGSASTWSAGANTTIDENGGNGSQSGASGTKCSGCLIRNTSTSAGDLNQITINATETANSNAAVVVLELNPTSDTISGSVVQASQSYSTSSSAFVGGVAVFRKSVTSNNLLAVCLQDRSTSTTHTVSDTDGNSYNNAVVQNDSVPTFQGQILYASGTLAGSSSKYNVITAVTVVTPVSIFVLEYSGMQVSTPLDKTASSSGSSTAPSSGATSTTTKTNELVLGYVACSQASGSISAGTGYTLHQSQALQKGNEDKSVTSTGAQTATFTFGVSSSWACLVATFINASQPAASTNSAWQMPVFFLG